MTAGKIILSFKGNNNKYLCGNPNIDFWKVSFQRYTNFSMQSIELDCDDKIYPKLDQDSIYRFKIHRYADLVDYIYLTINLPTIYSDENEEFKWIDYLGCGLLNYARLYHDSNLIEEIDGKYLYVFNKLYNDQNSKKYFNKLIGNIPELNHPYVNDYYKSYNKVSHTVKSHIDNVIHPKKNYNSKPSIESYQLNIPLIFSCFKNGNNLPLISLSKTEIYIEISIKSIRKLYTVTSCQSIELKNPSPSLRNYWLYEDTPIINAPEFRLKKRIIDTGDFSRFTSVLEYPNYPTYNLRLMKPTLNANYVFLDNKERKLFSSLDIHNLEIFVDHLNFYNLKGLNHLRAQLYHPIRNFIMLAQRDDISDRNEWLNFTNLDTTTCNPLSNQNQIFDIIREEAEQNNDELFKYFGSFLNLKLSDEQSIISNHNVETNFFDNGLIDNVVITKPGDYFCKVPETQLENIDNISLTGLETSIKLNLQHAIIYEPGNYKSVPSYKINTNNDNGDDAQIKLEIKDDKLYSVDVINSGSNYDNIIDISINKTYNIDEVEITNSGLDYTSQPIIYLYPFPNQNYTRDNIIDLNITDAQFNSTIINNTIETISIDNIGNNYNTDVANYKLYIGGQLDLNDPINISSNDNTLFTEIPNIHIHDGWNDIVKPVIDTTLSSGNLSISISNLEYENMGNYGPNGNLGYGLSSKTKVRSGKVIDKIIKKSVTNDFKINRKYITPELKFLPKKYITSHNIDSSLINNIYIDNTHIQPNIVPIISGDISGFDGEYNIRFFDNIVYNGNNIINYNGNSNDNIFKYPVFENVNITSNLSGALVNNSLILDYNLIDNINTNSIEIPNQFIDNVFDTAVFYIHYAEDKSEPIYSGLNHQIKIEKLIPNHSVSGGSNVLELSTGNTFNNIPIKILKDNVLVKNLDITHEFDGFKILNYTDSISDKNKTSLLFYIKNTNTTNFQKAIDIYEKNNEIFKLYMNDNLIDIVQITNEEYDCHKGMNKGDLINSTDLNVNTNTNKLLLLFGNFKNDVFSIEIGKKIRDFIKINEGHSYKNNPGIGLVNANGINKLDFRSVVNPNPQVNIGKQDAEFKPIVDYGGLGAEYDLEIAFGGASKNIKPFINLIKLDNKKLKLVFNDTYYKDNVYDNIFEDSNNTAVFQEFGSDKDNICVGYNQNPYYFVKNNNPNVFMRNDYEDIVVEGILDYGGSDGAIKIDVDHGGSGGIFEILEDNTVTNDANNVYYNINIKDSGIGYKDLSDNISYLVGTVVKYNKYRIEKATIIRQYNLKTVNGLIVPFSTQSNPSTGNNDNKLYLGSRINGDNVIDTNGSYVNNFKGICFVNPGDDGQNSNFISHPNINYSDGYDRIKLSTDLLSNTDPNKDKLIFIVGGIVDTDPIIVNSGKNYGRIVDDIKTDNNIDNSLIFNNLKDINKNPHIYSTVYNSYTNGSGNIVRFGEIKDIAIRTSINKDFQIDDSKIDILIKPEYIVTQQSSSDTEYNTSQFTLTSIEQRHSGLYPWDDQAFDLYFFDSYFYLYKTQIFNLFSVQIEAILPGVSNTIDNVTNSVLNSIFVLNSNFNSVIAYTPYWSSVHGEIEKGYDSPRGINSVQIVSSDFNDSPGNYRDYVKFTLDSNIPTPSDFGISNQGYIYPLDPNQFDVLRGEYIYFTDNVDAIIYGAPNSGNTSSEAITLYNKLPLIKFDEDTDTFSKIIPRSTFGSQLTSFEIKNNPIIVDDTDIEPNESLIDNYVNMQNDNVIIYTNLINKINRVSTGIGYYKKNRDEDQLVAEISDDNVSLYLRPIIDNDAEPAQIEVEFNDPDEDGKATINSVNLKTIDNELKQGKDYTEPPEIYFIDFFDESDPVRGKYGKLYQFTVFSRINTSLGTVKNDFVIEENSKIPIRAYPYIGGKITDLELYNYYKIPIRIKSAESSLLRFLAENIKNYSEIHTDEPITDSEYLKKFIEPYYLNKTRLKIGGNITELLLLNEGIDYKNRPRIFASYLNNGEYTVDKTFNPDSGQARINYNNINGRIVSLNLSSNIPCKIIGGKDEHQNDKYNLTTKNLHDANTIISNGGELKNIFIINTPNTLSYNFNYTKYSKINIGVSINDFIIDDIGSEIDDIYDYCIVTKQNIDNTNYYYNYNDYIYDISFKGSNITKKGINLTPNINNGHGYRGSADFIIHTGKGGKITTLSGLDNIIIDNIGNNYSNNKVIIKNGQHNIYENTLKWNSLDKSLIFDSLEYIDYNYIKKFNYNWIYRDSNLIPKINNNSVARLYDREIIENLEIFFNNKNREFISNIDLFKKLEKYEFWTNSDDNDIVLYSFSLNNNSNNPNGACNFSSLKDIKFKIKLKDMSPYEEYSYNLSIYFEYYNVKQYMNGIGAIKFAN